MKHGLVLALLLFFTASLPAQLPAKQRPLMKNFMGLNGHYTFKPELYAPTCRLARNYHSLNWDVDPADVSKLPPFPFARNKVNWDTQVYGKWKQHGFETTACLMFGIGDKTAEPKHWIKKPQAAFAYGKAFAQYFGPSGEKKLVTSAEIGNEPGTRVDDTTYRKVFEQMARGLRAGDPKLKIATCTATAFEADEYSKNLDFFKGLEELYDIINVHQYAQAEGWPTWKRSYPEDRAVPYLVAVEGAIDWRDKNAPGKEVWLTEFGYDSATPEAMKQRKKPFEKWEGVTDQEQAQWIVRSFLLFSALDLDRAYLYFYDDDDKASVHAASGLTRHFKPKPSYHAMAHLHATLGNYRFTKILKEEKGGAHLYEFRTEAEKRILVAWQGNAQGKPAVVALPVRASEIASAERMPLRAGKATTVSFSDLGGSGAGVEAGGSPVFVRLK